MFELSILEWKKVLDDLKIKYNNLLGKNDRLRCYCPFHKDTEPSFYVHKKWYMCYGMGCQKKGDVFDLVKKIKFNNNEMGFGEIIEYLSKFIDNEKLQKFKKYKKRQRKNFYIFEDWVDSNEDINIEDYKFLIPVKKYISKAKLIKNKNWDVIISCIKTFDYTDRVYHRDLLLIYFPTLGYYVYSKGGKLVSKILNKRDLFAFDVYSAGLYLSGNQISQISNPKEKTEFKVIQTTFYTENPIYYLNLKKYNNISLGIINIESMLNFQSKYVMFCFLLLDDNYTTIRARFKELFEFHKSNNIKWFYKIIDITEENYTCRVRKFLEINM